MISRHGVRSTNKGQWEAFFIDEDGIEILDGPYESRSIALKEHNNSVILLFDDPGLYLNLDECEESPLTQERRAESQ
jgi:hypothetical protein